MRFGLVLGVSAIQILFYMTVLFHFYIINLPLLFNDILRRWAENHQKQRKLTGNRNYIGQQRPTHVQLTFISLMSYDEIYMSFWQMRLLLVWHCLYCVSQWSNLQGWWNIILKSFHKQWQSIYEFLTDAVTFSFDFVYTAFHSGAVFTVDQT